MSPSLPRVLVTRSSRQSSELAERLRALGADPVLIPAIESVDPSSFTDLDTALAHLDRFHWLLFTSSNAVEAFARRLNHLNLRVPHLRDSLTVAKVGEAPRRLGTLPNIAAIGPATARALENIGLTPDLLPPQAIAESLTEALLPHTHQPDGSPTRFLLIRAEEAREHLPDTLRAAGAEVTVAAAYRTVTPEQSINEIRNLFTRVPNSRVPNSRVPNDRVPNSRVPNRRVPHSFAASSRKGGVLSSEAGHPPIEAITFTSSSTVRNLLALCEAAAVTLPTSVLRLSIGPITTQTLRDLGLPPHAESPEPTVAALAETVMNTLREHAPPALERTEPEAISP